MKTFLIVLAVIIALCAIAFCVWFVVMAKLGRCPLCILKAIGRQKLTIDLSEEEDYASDVSPSPIMGWSSWNMLRNHISEDAIYDTAQVLVKTGLADAGYRYVNIDDCWQSSQRDENGELQGDLETFPSGMEMLCRKINAIGLKMGLYSSNGTNTCEDLPASLGNEVKDAKTIVKWGAEYLKYDFCHHKNLSGFTPVIERLLISRRGNKAEIELKPEDAVFTGRARIIKVKKLPTGKGIGYLNHGAGTAQFTFEAPETNEYAVTVQFKKNLLNTKKYMQMIVNGKLYEVHFPSGRSFTPDARVQLTVKLQAGENTILLKNPIVTAADSAYTQYKRMGEALREASRSYALDNSTEERPVTFSICEWGFNHPWNWGAKAGNMWRTTMDIFPSWKSIVHIYNRSIGLYPFASPSHVNDPDMLEVGNGNLTEDENKAHFTLWCMMAAPLVLGNDLRLLLDGSSKSAMLMRILTNKSLILVDQDPLVKPAKRIKKGSIDTLVRPLYNGDTVVCFFNKTKTKKAVELDISTLTQDEYLSLAGAPSYEIHDLWSDEREHTSRIVSTVAGHGVRVFRIKAEQ